MTGKNNMKQNNKLNEKGQVAIFVALIFQLLFLFFAMVINVGLLIHHKINLQNSVDLAAYYGAMKQGETLNAIGHINYQIRQSWKLLSWRYRQLGSAGNFTRAHPFDKPSIEICNSPDCSQETILSDEEYKYFYEAPPFCITYVPFRPMPKGENTCKRAHQNVKIPLFKAPTVYAPFIGASRVLKAVGEAFLKSMDKQCGSFGPMNYIMLARFIAAFSKDQADKKLLMRHLAIGISESKKGFLDIDGKPAQDGMIETLKRNLTGPNLESFNQSSDVEIFNALASDDCNSSGVDSNSPPKWLSEIKIYPGFTYTDTVCDVAKAIDTVNVSIDILPAEGNRNAVYAEAIKLLKPYASGWPSAPYNYSLGYEKNPWCMSYVGIAAKTVPKIPFAPLGRVTLRARAFAKPFGGKIGPWYGDSWPVTSPKSIDSEGHRTDNLLPPRVEDIASIGPETSDFRRFANYSKYAGDKYGLKSRLTLGQWGKSIFALDKNFRKKPYQGNDNAGGYDQNPDNADAPNFNHWSEVGEDSKETKHGDILAWDEKIRGKNPMRTLETIAIAPDLFDITYYSIEPDYYNLYFKRIRDGFLPAKGGYGRLPRSDIGSRVGDSTLEGFSVKDQMNVVRDIANRANQIEIKQKLTYLVIPPDPSQGGDKVAPLLTSWVSKTLSNYSFSKEVFARCTNSAAPGSPTSGDCLGPGRTGYSVKLVSEDYLKSSNQPIGGPNTSGRIKNPPDSDLFQNILGKK